VDVLERIIARKKEEVAERKVRRPLTALRGLPAPPLRDFAAAIAAPGLSIIAEIKRRSPSRGPLREDLDPRQLARSYERGGAAALSVLTDQDFFGGSDMDLLEARARVNLPVLRKDFTIDEYQIHEARSLGADAILLIVRILARSQLAELLAAAAAAGLAALVEVHDEAELETAVACGAVLVGVNNRDLSTFEVSLAPARRLRELMPPACLCVAESGIETREDVRVLESFGYDAVLIGETLMRAENPCARLRELRGLADARNWSDER
jgi:indole-3-glycerol phosphate synthase